MFCIHMRWYITFLVFSDWNISCFDICWQWRYFLFNYCSLLRWSAYHEQQRSTHQKISRKKQWLDSRSVTRWQHYLFSSMAMLNCSILPNSQRRFKFCTLSKPPPHKKYQRVWKISKWRILPGSGHTVGSLHQSFVSYICESKQFKPTKYCHQNSWLT